MVECGLPKAETRVRFPAPAPLSVKDLRVSAGMCRQNRIEQGTSFWLIDQLPQNSNLLFRRIPLTFYRLVLSLPRPRLTNQVARKC